MAPTRSLIDQSEATSNSGGVAGRRGFRFQDHVGAGFLIDMLDDPTLVQVEFETGDDIVLRWAQSSVSVAEYIQVKTTDRDDKWGIKELKDRTKPSGARLATPGTSLIEKSLNCDRFDVEPLFRFVTMRGLRKDLMPFTLDRAKREQSNKNWTQLTRRFTNVFTTVRSPKGRDVNQWVERMYWQIEPSIEDAKAKSQNRISRLAERNGIFPAASTVDEIYNRLVNMVMDAGDACRIKNPDHKSITRQQLNDWWNRELEAVREYNQAHVRVYQVRARDFLTRFHEMDERDIRRTLHAYDVEFDLEQWRSSELIDYALEWLGEVLLPPKVLAGLNHLNARLVLRQAVSRADRFDAINDHTLFGELLIHAILRRVFDSEPIGCKIFNSSGQNVFSRCAHIVPALPIDQIWLGKAYVTTDQNHSMVAEQMVHDMTNIIIREFLSDERELIIQLREPQHMRNTTLVDALRRNGKLEDFLRALRMPLLIIYDSEVLGRSASSDYVTHLIDEVTMAYEDLKRHVPATLRDVEIFLFVLPVQGAANLISELERS